MNTPVATIERGDKRAMPHTPWPEVQPLPSRAPNPTRRPPTTIVEAADDDCGVGAGAWHLRHWDGVANKHSGKGRCDKSGDEGCAPGPVARLRIDEAVKNSANAGDAAGEQHEEDGRQPDQPTADCRRDRSEIVHDILSRPAPLVIRVWQFSRVRFATYSNLKAQVAPRWSSAKSGRRGSVQRVFLSRPHCLFGFELLQRCKCMARIHH